jgi:hypothetical protein
MEANPTGQTLRFRVSFSCSRLLIAHGSQCWNSRVLFWQGMMPAVGIQLQLEYPNNFSDEVCVRGRFNAVSFDNLAWAHRPLSTSLFMARIGALVQARAFAAIFGAKIGGCLSAVP